MYSHLDWKTLLKKVKVNNDRLAKEELLKRYLDAGCKWAWKQLNKTIYSDLIKPDQGEVISMVYQAFEKTIKHIDISKDKNVLSFKNFFFMMIRYQIFTDLKNVLNYKVISGFEKEKKNLINDMKKHEDNTLHNLDAKYKLEKLIEFLKSKNKEYAQIIEMRRDGFSNEEIQEQLGISWISLKGKLQYIKKLSLLRFGSSDGIS